uniref:Uncharacterized protein n=1 Tax=Anguilla anguilla TaxID=7936 RepID=A0A0E9TUM6_ANGAN
MQTLSSINNSTVYKTNTRVQCSQRPHSVLIKTQKTQTDNLFPRRTRRNCVLTRQLEYIFQFEGHYVKL